MSTEVLYLVLRSECGDNLVLVLCKLALTLPHRLHTGYSSDSRSGSSQVLRDDTPEQAPTKPAWLSMPDRHQHWNYKGYGWQALHLRLVNALLEGQGACTRVDDSLS